MRKFQDGDRIYGEYGAGTILQLDILPGEEKLPVRATWYLVHWDNRAERNPEKVPEVLLIPLNEYSPILAKPV